MKYTSLLAELKANLLGLNWLIVALASTIAATGIAMMASAGNGDFSIYASAQTMRFFLAFILMLGLALTPMRLLLRYAYVIYAGFVVILLGVDVAGHIGMGAQRWLKLGGLNLQPSEFMKLALILALARYFHYLHAEDIRRMPFLLIPVVLIAIPAIFILRQPNLGTTIILCTVGLILCFLAGLQWRYIISGIICISAALPAVWHFMHDYQKRRVLTFLDPSQDPLGAGYNILQSMIAIGSGGLFGKGFLHGTQNQLNFLPEKHTDFVFTIFAEEFGFFGCLLLILTYGLILALGMLTAARSRSTFGAMLAAGITALIFMHIMINCSMVMGMIPVVGIPLPLMSYGGSIMVSTMLGVGLLLNAYIHRDQLPTSGQFGLR